MPYKSENISISGTQFDRRVKLSPEQKQEIRKLYPQGYSYKQIAIIYGVSKRTVQFICNPNKYEIAKAQYRKRRLDGRYTPSKEDRNRIITEHRHYKHQLYKQGKI